MAILALLALYNNTHNEVGREGCLLGCVVVLTRAVCCAQSVVRSSGTLKCIMETATEDREAYQQACAAAFAFLEVMHALCRVRIGG